MAEKHWMDELAGIHNIQPCQNFVLKFCGEQDIYNSSWLVLLMGDAYHSIYIEREKISNELVRRISYSDEFFSYGDGINCHNSKNSLL